ncbi:MAG: hypothetical protein ABEN55_15885, partial [Bradymonadaceae bacterium]
PFGELVDDVDFSVHLGMYLNETAEVCDWHVPQSHPLEAWSDIRATDGTATVIQPLIERLYTTQTVHVLLAQLLGNPNRPNREIVREYWKDRWQTHRPGESFETGWNRALELGVVPGTEARYITPDVREDYTADGPPPVPEDEPGDETFQIVFRPDPTVWDGTYANNGWLQELPKPLTTLTWDNADLRTTRCQRRRCRGTQLSGHLPDGRRPSRARPSQRHGHLSARLRAPGWRSDRGGRRLRRLSAPPLRDPLVGPGPGSDADR